MVAVLFGSMVLVGCNSKNDATIKVKVEKDSQPVAGVLVYRFDSDLGDAFFANMVHADANAATDDQGVAEFKITTMDFLNQSSVSYVFETFDSHNKVNGKVAASVSKGGTKEVTIKQD